MLINVNMDMVEELVELVKENREVLVLAAIVWVVCTIVTYLILGWFIAGAFAMCYINMMWNEIKKEMEKRKSEVI